MLVAALSIAVFANPSVHIIGGERDVTLAIAGINETGIAAAERTSVPPSAPRRDAGDFSVYLVTEPAYVPRTSGGNGHAGVKILRAEHIPATARLDPRSDPRLDRDLVRLITPDPAPEGPADDPVLVEFQ